MPMGNSALFNTLARRGAFAHIWMRIIRAVPHHEKPRMPVVNQHKFTRLAHFVTITKVLNADAD